LYNDDEPRSVRKRRAILLAAESLFLEHGYLGTTMDEIAALAVVSKQTVYKHFADKERLFIEIVTTTVNEVGDPIADEILKLRDPDRVQDDLRKLAHTLLSGVMQPRLLALRRLVIGEAGRFPELGRAFYERGAGRSTAALAVVFERLVARGALSLDDPRLAAGHFSWLIMSAPMNQAMLLGRYEGPIDLDTIVATGVDAFLAAYGPRQPDTIR
jgi:TetR/AcrR family transcriptional regulator, mexJK operon transcriptional repressor